MNTNDEHREATNWLLKSLAGNVFLGAILFLSAGTIQWLLGWLFLATTILASVCTFLLVDDAVIVERSVNRRSTERWDNIIFTLFGIFFMLLTPVIAGLSVRYGWRPHIGSFLTALSFVFTIGGWALHIWAMRVNRFFAIVVRLQKERNQTVVTSGPYQWVRHPGYTGGIVFSIATPLLLGSFWALIPSIAAAALLVLRTYLEDQFLQTNLAGYGDYATHVRYRLLPGVW